MRKSNKKGFTIVELVIVIAVIAILSAVLIPTFAGITEKANESARDQEAKNAYTNYLIACDAQPVDGNSIKVGDYYYPIVDGQIDLDGEKTAVTGEIVWCSVHTDPTTDDDHDCDDCGAENVTEHNSVVDAAVAPTCTAEGKTAGSHCSECDAVLVAQETVDALDHNYVEGVCSVCGDEE